MAKGGRYLRQTQSPKKKGRGWKITLIVFLILVGMIGTIFVLPGLRDRVSLVILRPFLNKINQVEVEDKGASLDEIMDAANFNPDKPRETQGDSEP